MPNDDTSPEVRDFLSGEKSLWGRFVWRSQEHKDYSKAQATVVLQKEKVDARLILLARTTGNPLKFSISLLYENNQIMRLDVNPGRWHVNFRTFDKNSVTHWHVWPDMQTAIPDDHERPFTEWHYGFLLKAKIRSNIPITLPPQGHQSDFELN